MIEIAEDVFVHFDDIVGIYYDVVVMVDGNVLML